MSIKRAALALPVAALIALAGCSSESGEQSDSSESNSAADDQSSDGEQQDPQADGDAQQPEIPEPEVDDVPDIVAVVNGEEIDKDLFVDTYEGQLQQTVMSQQQQGGGDVDQDELKQQVVDQLVGNRLLVQAAEDTGIEASEDDIEATLQDIASQNGMESVDEVLSALDEQGVSEDEARSDAASQYAVTTLIDKEADVSEPSDDELREQYDQLVEQMGGGGDDAEGQIPPFEDVRDELADQAVTQQENEAVEGILDDLREDADVQVNL